MKITLCTLQMHFSLLNYSLIFTGYHSKCIIMISRSLLDILWYLKYVNNVKTFCKDFDSYRNTPQDEIKIISQIKFAILIFHGVELITWLLKMFHLTLLNLRAISHSKHCINLKNWQTNSPIIVRENTCSKMATITLIHFTIWQLIEAINETLTCYRSAILPFCHIKMKIPGYCLHIPHAWRRY